MTCDLRVTPTGNLRGGQLDAADGHRPLRGAEAIVALDGLLIERRALRPMDRNNRSYSRPGHPAQLMVRVWPPALTHGPREYPRLVDAGDCRRAHPGSRSRDGCSPQRMRCWVRQECPDTRFRPASSATRSRTGYSYPSRAGPGSTPVPRSFMHMTNVWGTKPLGSGGFTPQLE